MILFIQLKLLTLRSLQGVGKRPVKYLRWFPVMRQPAVYASWLTSMEVNLCVIGESTVADIQHFGLLRAVLTASLSHVLASPKGSVPTSNAHKGEILDESHTKHSYQTYVS